MAMHLLKKGWRANLHLKQIACDASWFLCNALLLFIGYLLLQDGGATECLYPIMEISSKEPWPREKRSLSLKAP